MQPDPLYPPEQKDSNKLSFGGQIALGFVGFIGTALLCIPSGGIFYIVLIIAALVLIIAGFKGYPGIAMGFLGTLGVGFLILWSICGNMRF